MALASTTVWEVRTTGNAANGGGFRAGATGTDYSQQDAAQVSYTDLAVDATTNTKVTSAANPFTSAHVGNLVNISSTGAWTPGYYEIVSTVFPSTYPVNTPVISGSINNGNFETAGTGGADVFGSWAEKTGGSSTVNDETVVTHSGSHACRLDVDSSNSTAYIGLSVQLTVGNRYTISFWAKCSTGTCTMRAEVGSPFSGALDAALTTAWTQFTADFTAWGVNFDIERLNAPSNSIYIDDVVLTDHGPASAIPATAVLDRSPAAVSSTGGAGKLGGAADHPATIAASVLASNVVWVKSGSYVLSANLPFSATVTPSSTAPYTRIEGYGTARGDGTRATLRAGGTATAVLALSSLNGYSVANLAVDGATTSANGIVLGQNSRAYNCKATGITGTAIQAGTGCAVETCEVTGCGGTYGINAPRVIDCNVHDNTCTGIYSPGGIVESCLVVNNTGTTSDGILAGLSTADAPVFRCTVHGNGRHGINWQATTAPLASGNILSSNGGYGFLCNASAGYRASPFHDGNAYYGNTSGTRSNGGDTTVNPQNASGAYANPLDKVLTVSPFTNAAGGDFSLNATAGGGASCRGAGFPTSWPGSTAISYIDMGAIQHQGGAFSVIGSPFIRGANT